MCLRDRYSALRGGGTLSISSNIGFTFREGVQKGSGFMKLSASDEVSTVTTMSIGGLTEVEFLGSAMTLNAASDLLDSVL